MDTVHLTNDEMQARIARFNRLEPLRAAATLDMPQPAKDLIYSRELLSVIGLDGAADTPINQSAPIKGAAGITMTLAVCPPGTGPSLHAHRKTFETFTVLEGRFEIRWNDDGGEAVVLERLDTISVPPGVCRAFRNVSDGRGILQVIISGGVHDMQDIDFTPGVAASLREHGAGVVEQFEARGLTFTAGTAAAPQPGSTTA